MNFEINFGNLIFLSVQIQIFHLGSKVNTVKYIINGFQLIFINSQIKGF